MSKEILHESETHRAIGTDELNAIYEATGGGEAYGLAVEQATRKPDCPLGCRPHVNVHLSDCPNRIQPRTLKVGDRFRIAPVYKGIVFEVVKADDLGIVAHNVKELGSDAATSYCFVPQSFAHYEAIEAVKYLPKQRESVLGDVEAMARL